MPSNDLDKEGSMQISLQSDSLRLSLEVSTLKGQDVKHLKSLRVTASDEKQLKSLRVIASQNGQY